MKKLWPQFLTLALWSLLVAFFAWRCGKEPERLPSVATSSQPHQRSVIRDTVEVIRHETTVVERLKPALTPEERSLLKDIHAKLKVVESMQTAAIENHGTVTLRPDTLATQPPTVPLVAMPSQPPDTAVLRYSDHWARFAYYPLTRSLDYSVRDSLTTVVARRYKHRFLWWRWGVKGYDISVINHNPHATITYDRYVRAKE